MLNAVCLFLYRWQNFRGDPLRGVRCLVPLLGIKIFHLRISLRTSSRLWNSTEVGHRIYFKLSIATKERIATAMACIENSVKWKSQKRLNSFIHSFSSHVSCQWWLNPFIFAKQRKTNLVCQRLQQQQQQHNAIALYKRLIVLLLLYGASMTPASHASIFLFFATLDLRLLL